MASQVHRKPPSRGLPCLSTALFMFLLLFCSQPNSCTGAGCEKDQAGNITGCTFDKLPGHLCLHTGGSASDYCDGQDKVWGGLGSYIKTYYPKINVSDNGFFLPLYPMQLDGRSFSVAFTMSLYQPNSLTKASHSSLSFVILPELDLDLYAYDMFSMVDAIFGPPSNTTYVDVSGSMVSTTIYAYSTPLMMIYDKIPAGIGIQIDILRPRNSSAANNYSVWIDYYGHANRHRAARLWVYVAAGEGTSSKPASVLVDTTLIAACMMPDNASFAFYTSVGQLEQLHTWDSTIGDATWNSTTIYDDASNSTMEWPPNDYYCMKPSPSNYYILSNSPEKKTIILSSLLGSAGAIAIAAAGVYFYMKSKYRRWKKEQDKLVKTMQCLPGVPTQVDYADIRKATSNFHEATKLGRGGFGSVYGCTLPAAASRTGQPIMVAVKKFTRELADSRYEHFLAEVSIINRLRHKNIVPLVGWSYNRGEPLLIYENMKNGSLDQHLFPRGGVRQRQNSGIGQWGTRYKIAKDIATGLHYLHHEHEPVVLHRDIKASNILLDSNFCARLGDFGIACTVAAERSSITGVAGTFGYIAPEYLNNYKATRQTDIYAFGVVILEVVTGRKNLDTLADDVHIADWVRRLHRDGRLLEALDGTLVSRDHQPDVVEEAERLLLLGLACTNPEPSSRPSMAEVVQIVNKLAPPPEVSFERPKQVSLPEEGSWVVPEYGVAMANQEGSSESRIELVQVCNEQQPPATDGGHVSIYFTPST